MSTYLASVRYTTAAFQGMLAAPVEQGVATKALLRNKAI